MLDEVTPRVKKRDQSEGNEYKMSISSIEMKTKKIEEVKPSRTRSLQIHKSQEIKLIDMVKEVKLDILLINKEVKFLV